MQSFEKCSLREKEQLEKIRIWLQLENKENKIREGIIDLINNHGQYQIINKMNQYTENDKQSENIDDFNDESPVMNPNQMVNNLIRTRSDESVFFLGRMLSQTVESQKPRPLIINISNCKDESQINDIKVFKKTNKKEKKKKQSDYYKNICGYITKKIIREFCSPSYANHVKQLCTKYKCDYRELKNFYLPKIEQVTGPSHIPSLLISTSEEQKNMKQLFKQFCGWFVKNRYLRYLLIEGKMSDKKAYIKYKNHILLSILNDSKEIKLTNQQQQDIEQLSQSVDSMESQEKNHEQKQTKANSNNVEKIKKQKNKKIKKEGTKQK